MQLKVPLPSKKSLARITAFLVIFGIVFSYYYFPDFWLFKYFHKNIETASAAKTSWSVATSTATWTVPTGVTTIVVKAWGAGGGGSGGGRNTAGSAGGGGGFASSTLTVTPSETLNIFVGGGGGLGANNATSGSDDGGGGGGGGYSGVQRSSTFLVIAGGGGGGGASSQASETGGAGGAGGGSSGVAGSRGADAACDNSAAGVGEGGSPGTQSGAGAGGSGCSSAANGTGGSGTGGGAGAASGTTNPGGTGGTNGGANGGNGQTIPGGGGGGGGYYGGGGGEIAATTEGSGGGGGGSASSTGTNFTLTAGSGATPGNSGDADRATYCSTAGNGGSAGPTDNNGSNGQPGCIVIMYNVAAPAFTSIPTESADPADTGASVTFSATAGDAAGDSWFLAVCKTNSITPGSPPTCATDQTICTSTSAVASSTQNTCSWTASSTAGTQAWYAFACDTSSSTERCSSYNATNSPIMVKGTMALADQTVGQLTDQFYLETATTSELFGFRLTPTGESASTTLTLTLSSISGIAAGDITSGNIYVDANSDGRISAGESTTAFGCSAPSISAPNGTISCLATSTVSAATNYIYKATVSNLAAADTITFGLSSGNIIAVGATSQTYSSKLTLSGSASNVTHTENNPANTPTTHGHTNQDTTTARWTWASGGSQDGYTYGPTSACAAGTTTNLYWDESSLTANTQYTRYVRSYFSPSYYSSVLTIGPYYTSASTPNAPTVDTPTATTLNVNPVTGGAETSMAIYAEAGAACDGAGGLGYVQANGSIAGGTVWQADATWSTVTVTGLTASTQYAFCVQAQNGDGDTTAWGTAAANTTSSSGVIVTPKANIERGFNYEGGFSVE